MKQYIDLPRIPSELPPYEIVEFVLKRAKAIRQQETYHKACSMPPSNVFDPLNPSLMIEDLEVFTESQDVQACSMPPSNVFDPLNPSLMIEDLEVFTESQDVQACDPTNNYLSSPSNQSLSIEGIIIFIDLQDGPTCNQNLKDVLCIIW